MKTYASLADLKRRLAITSAAADDDLALALVAATRWVDLRTDSEVAADDAWTGDADNLVVETDPPAAFVQATIGLAVRFYKSADVPFGVAGMSDQGLVAYVRSTYPEADLLLFGRRQTFGIA